MAEIDLLKLARDFNDNVTNALVNEDFKSNYRKSTTFTGQFYRLMEEVLKSNNIAEYKKFDEYKKQQLYYQKEKLTVDLTVWKSENDGKIITKSKQEMPYLLDGYIWKYILLIEHENSGKTWLQEMQKLCTISSKYKLIITYGRNEKDENGFKKTGDYKGVNILKYATKILNNYDDITFEEFVIMFGEENPNIDKLNGKKVYDIWLCKKGESMFTRVD
ncbi:MAG: hypothetical protein Q8N92_02045 [Erysipelotrichaceae bacterium]|nr:hypothetical protein [Erysipelotrichaceae bacterium]